MTIFERVKQWIYDIKERLQWFIEETDFTRLFVMLLIFLICICSWTMAFMVITKRVHAETASYYTYNSCKKEGTSGIYTASGEKFDENDLTCAMRSREWGTKYKITNINNGKSVIVKLNDFGPSKKLWNKGRKVDLSKEAFKRIASLKQGIINVKIERLK